MSEPQCTLDVTFRPNVVNGWFLRAFARPFVEVDGVETACAWGRATRVGAAAGALRVTTFIRYRGLYARLGSGTIEFIGAGGVTYRLVARNGVMNQTPFTPELD